MILGDVMESWLPRSTLISHNLDSLYKSKDFTLE